MTRINAKNAALGLALTLGLAVTAPQALAETLVKDEGFTNAVHKKRAGTIVFANKKIDRAKPKESAFITTSSLDKPLYLRVYLKQSFENYYRKDGGPCTGDPKRRMLRVFLDEQETFLESKSMHVEDWNDWTSYPPLGKGPLNRKPSFAMELKKGFANEDQTPYAFWTRLAPRLKPGKNKLRFEAVSDCGLAARRKILAAGELTLVVNKRTAQRLLKKNRPNLPRSTMKGQHSRIKKAIQAKWPSLSVKDVTVTSKSWRIKRHPIHGHPVERTIQGWAVVDGPKEGCQIMSITMTQLANGKKYERDFRGSIYTGRHRPFSCPK